MDKKYFALGLTLFSLGILAGIAGTSLWAFSKQQDFATRVIAWNTAQNSGLLDSLITMANEDKLDVFSNLATVQLRLNILDLDRLVEGDVLTADERHAFEATLKGLAHRRDRLRLGAFAEEPDELSERIEAVLSKYDPPAR